MDARFQGKHILILEGYARQCLPYMRAFKKLGLEVTIYCHSKMNCGFVSRFPDHRVLGTCKNTKYKETEKNVIKLVKSGKYDIVLPLVDFSAEILAHHKKELSKYAIILTNDEDVFMRSQDKLEVMRVCMENGLPCPVTLFDLNSVEDVIGSGIRFPIVIKPRIGFGARGFNKFYSEQEFREYVTARGIDLKEMVIQECLPDNCLNASDNVFIDRNGVMKSAFTYASYRYYPLKGGTGTLNGTIDRSDVHATSKKLAELMGIKGCNGIDYMIDPRDGKAKVIEINPRVLACSKIGFVAGVNQALQVLEDAFHLPVTPMFKYKTDIRVRMSQIDFLWLLKSPDRFKSKPSWFSCKHTVDQTFSWDDPLPWFAFLFGGLHRFGEWKEQHQ